MPTANPDFYTCPHDQTLYVPDPGVLTNDTDPNPLEARLVSGVSHGQLVLYPAGSFDYAPDPGFTGTDSFEYKAVDNGGVESGPATVQITVQNSTPTVVGDTYSTVHDQLLAVSSPGVLANDIDSDGDSLTAKLASGPAHGQLILYSDGGFDYMPEAGFVGTDTFTYQAEDGAASSAATTVTINVTNQVPNTAADAYQTIQDVALFVPTPGVLANDIDPDGDTLRARRLAGPSHGQLLLGSDGEVAYCPDPGYIGVDSFQYVANDGAADSTATQVTIEVTAPPPLPTA